MAVSVIDGIKVKVELVFGCTRNLKAPGSYAYTEYEFGSRLYIVPRYACTCVSTRCYVYLPLLTTLLMLSVGNLAPGTLAVS